MKEKVTTENSTLKNRQIVSHYLDQNILLWMFWSLTGMVYSNLQSLHIPEELHRIDIVMGVCFQYIFFFIVMMAIGISKILKLTDEEAYKICKAINKDYEE